RLRRVQRREQQAALAAERQRIVRDLHDSLGANLTRLTLLAELAEQESPTETPARQPRNLVEAAHRTTQSLKEFLWATQPLDESLDGLLARICQIAEELMGAASIRCRLDLPVQLPSVTVGPVARKNIALATTEALNNIARHSGATGLWIRARWEDGALLLQIEDDGRGFDPARPGCGRGLGHMRARIREAGGEFQLESQPGHGTSLRIRVPFHALVQ
ncbi:MAG TPA: sensor histidine kinase, partial [Methylomirabilota bacterium]|nr:sensor histidine kinase [Methylomirabilota bacterium]